MKEMKRARPTSSSSSSDDSDAGVLGALGGLLMMKKLLEELEVGAEKRKAGIEMSKRFRVRNDDVRMKMKM